MDRIQHFDPLLQILHPFPDLPVGSQLLADHGHCILPALGEHIIPDELSRSACHPQRNGALLHGDHTPLLNIAEDHLIECIKIGFL